MPTMKAVRIHSYGGSELMVYDDMPMPVPAAGEVLVHVRAAGVNPLDWKIREGYMRQYLDLPLPFVLGRDFAGDVAAVGPQTPGFAVGTPVFGAMQMTGAHAEYVTVAHRDILPKPATVDYETAAAVPLAALAAWQAVVEAGQLTAGQTVLIHGAAGGVGSFAVQIARLRGARVLGTASHANAEFVRSLGADEVIDYEAVRFEEVVHDVDVVVDTIGGDTQQRSWRVLKPGGRLLSLVSPPSAGEETGAPPGAQGAMVATRHDVDQLQEIAGLVEAGQIKPVVTTILPLAQARDAYELSARGHVRGKIVLQVTSD